MDVREKLVEICFHEFCMVAGDSPCGCDGCPYGKYGSDGGECYEEYKNDKLTKLEKAGVTVQEWISVNDRLPEKPMKCLVYTKRGEYGGYEITYYNEGFYLQYANATHWMPLPDVPQPPKGE